MPSHRQPDPSIGERIRDRRELRGWSIRFAASRAGIAHTTWGRLEKGEIRSDRYTISDVAAALECSVADLTGQPHHPPSDRALETAHAAVPALWRALIEIAPDEPPSAAALPTPALTSRTELLNARRCAGDYAAAARLLPELLGDLHSATFGPDPRIALLLSVDVLHNAMLTLRHLGYTVEPALAAERCRQAAERLDEPVPLAVADWCRAHAAFAAGSYSRALTLTTRAIDALDHSLDQPGAHEVLGMLHVTSAVATLPRRPDESDAHIAEAAALAERTGESPAWGMGWGPSNVAVWRMTTDIDGGRPDRAVAAARAVDVAQLSTARGASFYVELSRALTDLRKDEEAVRMLLAAERTAPQLTRSSVAARENARFLLHRARSASALAGLCERLGVVE